MSLSAATPSFVSFVDTDGDQSKLSWDYFTQRLSWFVSGHCHLENITILEYVAVGTRGTITAPENAALVAQLADPPAGPGRDRLLSDIVQMAARATGIQLRGFEGVPILFIQSAAQATCFMDQLT